MYGSKVPDFSTGSKKRVSLITHRIFIAIRPTFNSCFSEKEVGKLT